MKQFIKDWLMYMGVAYLLQAILPHDVYVTVMTVSFVIIVVTGVLAFLLLVYFYVREKWEEWFGDA